MTTNFDRLLAADRLIMEAMQKMQQAALIINHIKTELSPDSELSTDVENDECLE